MRHLYGCPCVVDADLRAEGEPRDDQHGPVREPGYSVPGRETVGGREAGKERVNPNLSLVKQKKHNE